MKPNIIIVIARVFIALIFIPSGLFKLIDNPSAVEYMTNVGGIPASGILSWVVGIFEVVAGISVIIGYKTRYFAYGMIFICVFTAIFFHAGKGSQIQFSEAANIELMKLHTIMVLKNLSMAGGLLLLSYISSGSFSIDSKNKTT